jgi:anti-sigma factor RsiW
MSDNCGRTFDEALLSGYVDRVLTQGDRQRVELHLEACRSCRTLVDELADLRAAALSTVFPVPDDRQWDERPRGPASRAARRAGWIVLLVWLLGAGAYAAYHLALVTEGWTERLLVFGGFSGLAVLLLSVLLDRIRDMKTDRYRGVLK